MNHIICEFNENERIQWFNLFRNTNISFCHKTKCERCWEKIVTSTSLYAPICSGCVCTCTLYKNGLTRLMSANWLKSWKKQQRKSILHIFVLTSNDKYMYTWHAALGFYLQTLNKLLYCDRPQLFLVHTHKQIPESHVLLVAVLFDRL